jgi:hypothetical protein
VHVNHNLTRCVLKVSEQALVAAVAGAFAGHGPTHAGEPWYAWLLAALVRQLARQRWHVRFVEEHGLRDLDRDGSDEGDGDVPGMPGYRFFFHGMGCAIKTSTNELIDVDDHGDGGLTIDPYFFVSRIESLHGPEVIERRLRQLMPSRELLVSALADLRARGILWHPSSNHVFRLPPSLEALDAERASAPIPPSDARDGARRHARRHVRARTRGPAVVDADREERGRRGPRGHRRRVVRRGADAGARRA